jgi:hypothetical protein
MVWEFDISVNGDKNVNAIVCIEIRKKNWIKLDIFSSEFLMPISTTFMYYHIYILQFDLEQGSHTGMAL